MLYRYQYTYDGVGNRLTENNAGVITYSYDANNKLTQLVGPSGTTTFGYDNNGNTTSMTQPGPVTTTYGYGYENRLVSVANPSYTAAYTYAPDGLRLRIQESNAQYPDRWLQYDGVRPVLEGTLDTEGVFTTLNKYVWEGNGYYDPLVYSLIGGAWRYHMYDGLGSTRQLMLHAYPYTITDTYSYEAFGNLMASTGTTPNPYRFVGSLGYYQTGSSLMHLGARYYVPELGRLMHRDPVGAAYMYAYADDDPVDAVDPAGAKPTCGPWRDDPQPCYSAPFKTAIENFWTKVDEWDKGVGCACKWQQQPWKVGWFKKQMHQTRKCCENGRTWVEQRWKDVGVEKRRLERVAFIGPRGGGPARYTTGDWIVVPGYGLSCSCPPPNQ